MWGKLFRATLAWMLLFGLFLAPFSVIQRKWLAALAGAGLIALLIGGGLFVIWVGDRRSGR
jgi:hypothetical protein